MFRGFSSLQWIALVSVTSRPASVVDSFVVVFVYLYFCGFRVLVACQLFDQQVVDMFISLLLCFYSLRYEQQTYIPLQLSVGSLKTTNYKPVYACLATAKCS